MQSERQFFLKDSSPSKNRTQEIAVLLSESFRDKRLLDLWITLSKPPEIIGVKMLQFVTDSNDLIGFALGRERVVRLHDSTAKSLSVGLVALNAAYRGRGLGTKFIRAILDEAFYVDTDLVYLQGIPHFYSKIGFRNIMPRTKVVLETSEINEQNSIAVQDVNKENIPHLSHLYEQLALNLNFSSLRSPKDWVWLLENVKGTFLFYSPKVVMLDSHCLGYFTTDPVEHGRVREAVYCTDFECIRLFVAGIVSYLKQKHVDTIEIMTWENSPLCRYLKGNENHMMISLHTKSRGMLGISKNEFFMQTSFQKEFESSPSTQDYLRTDITLKAERSELDHSFIFQGDNL